VSDSIFGPGPLAALKIGTVTSHNHVKVSPGDTGGDCLILTEPEDVHTVVVQNPTLKERKEMLYAFSITLCDSIIILLVIDKIVSYVYLFSTFPAFLQH
jgi:hypothetical protein